MQQQVRSHYCTYHRPKKKLECLLNIHTQYYVAPLKWMFLKILNAPKYVPTNTKTNNIRISIPAGDWFFLIIWIGVYTNSRIEQWRTYVCQTNKTKQTVVNCIQFWKACITKFYIDWVLIISSRNRLLTWNCINRNLQSEMQNFAQKKIKYKCS